jgi:predicted DNA-binding transcriptional regulator YafY
MSQPLTDEDLKKIYLILKSVDEGQLVYPAEEWELDHFDEKLVDKKGIKPVLSKLRKSLPEQDAKEIDKQVLLRRYSVFGSEVDEAVYSKLENAFEKRNTVEIEYFSIEKAEAIKRKIDIYYKSRRYVIAFCHLRNTVRKFRTSRIISARLTGEKYSIPEDFDKRKFL